MGQMNKVGPNNHCFSFAQEKKVNNFLIISATLVTIASLALVVTAVTGTLPLFVAYICGAVGTISLIAFGVLFCCKAVPPNNSKKTKPIYTATPKPVTTNTSKKSSQDLLIPFYTGEGKDLKGRTIEDILKFGYDLLESEHDFVQWIFPNFKPSDFYSHAPLLTKEILATLKNDPTAQGRLFRAYQHMLDFYGLEYIERDNRVQKQDVERWTSRKLNWIINNKHNYRRITRILKCLVLMGREDLAQAFLVQLEKLAQEEAAISSRTLAFWKQALHITA